jgi:hypothetical protein
VFYGSDFIEDAAEDAAYKLIRDIVNCMNKGTFCILLNLERIYQSFYDMLNQSYQDSDGKLFCKIAIGSDVKMKLVHPAFKCALLIEQERIGRLDLPLLNRFEKQVFTDDFIMDELQGEVHARMMLWCAQVSTFEGFTYDDMFPCIDENYIQGLVIANSVNSEGYRRDIEQIESACKLAIM